MAETRKPGAQAEPKVPPRPKGATKTDYEKPPPKKGKGGRPEAVITTAEMEQLGALHPTTREMAAWFGVSLTTMDRHLKKKAIAEAFERGKAGTKINLRRKQIQVALAGNVKMLIYLGNIMLDQIMKKEAEVPDREQIDAAERIMTRLGAYLDKAKKDENG